MMKITMEYIKGILDTLPVGYYLGTRAEVEFSPVGASYCNLMDGTIHVSGENVMSALKHCKTLTPQTLESYTRTILYHEVSHLILTPKIKIADWFNIFEDERIETILSKYYLDVDFKKFIYDFNGWTPDTKPTNAQEFFYEIVRYRQGPKQFVDRVSKIINMFRSVNSSYTEHEARRYVNEVERFWEDVRRYWNDPQNQQQRQQQQQNQQGGSGSQQNQNQQQSNNSQNGNGQQNQQQDQNGQGGGNQSQQQDQDQKNSQGGQQGSQGQNDGDQQNQQSGGGSGDQEQNQSGSQNESSGSGDKEGKDKQDKQSSGGAGNQNANEQSGNKQPQNGATGNDSVGSSAHVQGDDDQQGESAEDLVKKAVQRAIQEAQKQVGKTPADITRDKVRGIMERQLNTYFDAQMSAEFERMIIRNNKKRSMRSPFSNGYTGKVDPRSVALRRDYRWFVRKGDSGSNKFNKTHLTLWVDTSGSFYGAIDRVNTLIHTLIQLERQMRGEFTFDVVSMSMVNVIADKRQALDANGCNFFGPKIVEIASKLRKSNAQNFNVAVWDGDMFSGVDEYDAIRRYGSAFKVFDNSSSVIVSDTDNEQVLRKHCPHARSRFIKQNYEMEFIKAVTELLNIAIG